MQETNAPYNDTVYPYKVTGSLSKRNSQSTQGNIAARESSVNLTKTFPDVFSPSGATKFHAENSRLRGLINIEFLEILVLTTSCTRNNPAASRNSRAVIQPPLDLFNVNSEHRGFGPPVMVVVGCGHQFNGTMTYFYQFSAHEIYVLIFGQIKLMSSESGSLTLQVEMNADAGTVHCKFDRMHARYRIPINRSAGH
ncbi:hypothetical protein ALC62_01576 [Cyphomyrmex costatus]|uniref:Uncharacterized protein n=1 Tax=Cyphomyrmex costatus TaxID=456900 RepID=A0A195D4L8_9HYME|nr:hypothetical protein ALC62_01576 [Cyphomyrmex costatus]